MDKTELKEVLDSHAKWLNDEECGERANLSRANLSRADLRSANLSRADLSGVDLSGADLRSANLSGVDLSGVDLSGVDLSGANLSGVDLDYATLPLSCGGLNFKIDERLAKQFLFHALNLIQYSDIEIPKDRESLINYANEFHRGDVERLKEEE